MFGPALNGKRLIGKSGEFVKLLRTNAGLALDRMSILCPTKTLVRSPATSLFDRSTWPPTLFQKKSFSRTHMTLDPIGLRKRTALFTAAVGPALGPPANRSQ